MSALSLSLGGDNLSAAQKNGQLTKKASTIAAVNIPKMCRKGRRYFAAAAVPRGSLPAIASISRTTRSGAAFWTM
jgi:hypothetical protein